MRRTKSVESPEHDVARPKAATLAAFTHDMRQHAVLNREEEVELFARWKTTGDRRIADQLVAANLRLVLMIAKQYCRWRYDVLDLVQEGSIGLFHALSKFDPTLGIRFTSYATYWIRAYVLKFIVANHHLVKIGTTQAQRKLFFNLNKTRVLLEKSGQPATVEQIAEMLKVDAENVVDMELRMAASPMSIDATGARGAGEGSDDTPLFQFAAVDEWRPDVRVETRDFSAFAHERIHAFGKRLDGRERILFDKRLVAEDPVTLIVLAEEWGVTRERVRQIEERLKDKLRRYLVRTSD